MYSSQERSRHPLPGERCRSLGRVLHPAPRFHVGASEAPGVRECLAGRCADAAQWSRCIRLAADAEWSESGAWWMEPCRAEGLGSPGLYRCAQERRAALPERDGNRSRRTPDSDRRSGRQPDRAVRTSAIAELGILGPYDRLVSAAASNRSWGGAFPPGFLPAGLLARHAFRKRFASGFAIPLLVGLVRDLSVNEKLREFR